MTSLPTAAPSNRPERFGLLSPTRLGALGLELHPDKTKSSIAKTANRRGDAEHTSFDFLGYTFRARRATSRRGLFVSFLPAMRPISEESGRPEDQGLAPQPSHWADPVRSRHGHQRPGQRLDQLLWSLLPLRVVLPCNAYQRASRSMGDAEVQTAARPTNQGMGLAGCCPTAPPWPLRPLAHASKHPQPTCGGRMRRESHVRSCESGTVRFPSRHSPDSSRPVLREPGGETPPGHSPEAAGFSRLVRRVVLARTNPIVMSARGLPERPRSYARAWRDSHLSLGAPWTSDADNRLRVQP